MMAAVLSAGNKPKLPFAMAAACFTAASAQMN